MSRILVLGAGGHGRAVAEAIGLGSLHTLVGFLDDSTRQPVLTIPVLGRITDLGAFRHLAEAVVVAIGKNSVRQALHERVWSAGFEIGTVIHPTAIISPSAIIGRGSTVMAGAIVGAEAELGEGVVVNAGAIVDHHCKVGAFGHLGTGAAMAGGSRLAIGAWMQAGSALGYGVELQAGGILRPAEGKFA